MNRSVWTALLVTLLTVPIVTSAQQTDRALTRAQVRAELVRFEQAGYHSAYGEDPHYPADVEAVTAKLQAHNAGCHISGIRGQQRRPFSDGEQHRCIRHGTFDQFRSMSAGSSRVCRNSITSTQNSRRRRGGSFERQDRDSYAHTGESSDAHKSRSPTLSHRSPNRQDLDVVRHEFRALLIQNFAMSP